jgi:threonine dehydratase
MQQRAAISADGLVSLDAIQDAAARVAGVARRTALVDASQPWDECRLLLKCENQQPAGAFKIRGAYNMMVQLPLDIRRRGVITYSSGNHGQAVALSAKLLGAPAVIVMPTTAPAIKVDGARAVVHHVLVAIQQPNGGIDERSYLAVYVPGDTPSVYPKGYAKRLKAGTTLVFQVHYTPNGK